MTRLIDADKIEYTSIAHLASYPVAPSPCDTVMRAEINAIPTVDAVPVIRCKDCQYWMKNPYRESSVFGLCFKHKDIAIATDETDWCSWAERRTE